MAEPPTNEDGKEGFGVLDLETGNLVGWTEDQDTALAMADGDTGLGVYQHDESGAIVSVLWPPEEYR